MSRPESCNTCKGGIRFAEQFAGVGEIDEDEEGLARTARAMYADDLAQREAYVGRHRPKRTAYACTDLAKFSPLDIARNHRLLAEGKDEDCMSAYRARMEIWGQERTVVVMYNPRTARKRAYTMTRKLEMSTISLSLVIGGGRRR